MSIQCMIIDDEPIAQTILETYIERVPSLKLIKKCKNPVEAAGYLLENTVDLIFLDINMPQMTGFEFLETLPAKPAIIITTAYSGYALKGYEYSVLDYLLKPFSFGRFIKAVNKLTDPRHKNTFAETRVHRYSHRIITILNSDDKEINIDTSRVLYIEGYGNYAKIHYESSHELAHCTLQKIEQEFPKDLFFRIHKSYICSIEKITEIDKKNIYLGRIPLPIGNAYSMLVKEKLNKKG